MLESVRKAALAVLASVAVTATSAVAVSAAPLINEVPCTRSDFLHVWYHPPAGLPDHVMCFANAGEITRSNLWLTKISTGNNRVQWFGDGRWQPSSPINKNTVYTFPNNPGGVRFDKIRIL